MKLLAFGLDANGRSTSDYIEVPLTKISDTESITAKQPGTIWRIGTRGMTRLARTDKDYAAAGGPFEMHVGGVPHFIGWMTGYNENTLQDGSVMRLAPGDFVYIRPAALHHSNPLSAVMPIVFNLYLPGTDEDIGPFVFKT
jgi:hypothetical protein